MHQLRLHLATLGYPICGDHLYGNRTDNAFPRTLLHAWQLHFLHPLTNRTLHVKAPLYPDMLQNIQETEIEKKAEEAVLLLKDKK